MAVVEQREAGGARARHAHEPRAVEPRQRIQRVADRRRNSRRARLQVVAAGLERFEARAPRLQPASSRGAGGASSEAPGARPSAANTAGVATATPGWRARRPAAASASAGPSRSPRPAIGRARGSRQTGTSAPTAAAAANRRSSSGARPLAAASARNAAAASLEPPPRPAATGRALRKWKRPSLRPRNPLGERARRAQHEIVVGRPGGRGGRPVDRQAQRFRRLERQPVAAAGEGDDAVEFVPAVGAAAEHVQRQIDLGRGAPEPRRTLRQV